MAIEPVGLPRPAGNAEGFGYSMPGQDRPMVSSGPSSVFGSAPKVSPSAGVTGSLEYGKSLTAGQGFDTSTSRNRSFRQSVDDSVEHKAESSGLKQGLKQIAKRVFSGSGEDAAAGDAADAAATGGGGALLGAGALAAGAGFLAASQLTGHPSARKAGQSKMSWVNQNISTGQFAPEASQKLYHQETGKPEAHPGR